jgi:hypothetical protein
MSNENKKLREINQKLELDLFWNDYGVNSLCTMMARANKYHPNAPMCTCLNCSYTERSEYNSHNNGISCLFKPWFEQKLDLLQIKTLHGYPLQNVEQLEHVCSGDTEYVLDVDAHFVNMAQQNWTWFTYGASLWKATSIHDPQIQKLASLFDELNKN